MRERCEKDEESEQSLRGASRSEQVAWTSAGYEQGAADASPSDTHAVEWRSCAAGQLLWCADARIPTLHVYMLIACHVGYAHCWWQRFVFEFAFRNQAGSHSPQRFDCAQLLLDYINSPAAPGATAIRSRDLFCSVGCFRRCGALRPVQQHNAYCCGCTQPLADTTTRGPPAPRSRPITSTAHGCRYISQTGELRCWPQSRAHAAA